MAKKTKNEGKTEKYIAELQKLIKSEHGGKLPPKLVPMIEAAARCRKMLDRVEEAIDETDVLLVEVGSQGQTKQTINPMIAQHEKYLGRLSNLYYELGLSNRKQAGKQDEGAGDDNPFAGMLNKMKK